MPAWHGILKRNKQIILEKYSFCDIFLMSANNNTLEKYMQYVDFQKVFKDFTVFSLVDMRQVEPGFYRRRLNEWQEKGYIKKVIKGYYISSDLALDEKILFEIANRIYGPSYVSFEMALGYYELIPESVYGITSASTRKTSHFITPVGEFLYRTIHPKLYFGFEFLNNNGKLFKLASPEKAFLDFLYIKTELRDAADFKGLRINREIFHKLMDRNKMNVYLNAYGQKSLKRRVDNFLGYIGHA
ncbi:MAG: hypothetical protein L6416_08185 [Candidatus Omnitrophica bacterium]|nr:hypothetical protein [Candidatus Omnitrophota bacterium]